jgi:hypothetical protein
MIQFNILLTPLFYRALYYCCLDCGRPEEAVALLSETSLDDSSPTEHMMAAKLKISGKFVCDISDIVALLTTSIHIENTRALYEAFVRLRYGKIFQFFYFFFFSQYIYLFSKKKKFF